MIPPLEVSPLIKLCRYSALLLGIIYGARRYAMLKAENKPVLHRHDEKKRSAYLKPIAVEDRRLEAEEKAKQEELNRIAKALEEAQESILK